MSDLPDLPDNHELSRSSKQGGQAPDDQLIGKTIAGKYQIISLLGEGGMSVVYKARQFPINKTVAIKMLLSHLSNDENSQRRFMREAQAAGQFSHPNVVSVLDFGFERIYPFLVMDYLEGQSLGDILKERGSIPYEEAIPLFTQICDGLGAAHKSGVIHRDIKPSNIVIQNEADGSKRVRVVDFGIAKMIDAESQHLTKTGEIFGSPLYMSPEQCEGVPLDRRSDIYSLGVVMYEILSGKRPLAGQSALETMWLHVEEMPASLQKSAEGVHIPLALENIVFKMLEKDREKRYSSMEEVKNDLQAFAAGESKAISGNLSYMGREISRKSRILISAAVTILVCGVTAYLTYPHALAALANFEISQGNENLAKKSQEGALPHFQKAADYSKMAGDKALENKALGLLIDSSGSTQGGKAEQSDIVKKARERRQKLIKEVLERFDLNATSVDDMLASVSNSSAGAAGGANSDGAAQSESDTATDDDYLQPESGGTGSSAPIPGARGANGGSGGAGLNFGNSTGLTDGGYGAPFAPSDKKERKSKQEIFRGKDLLEEASKKLRSKISSKISSNSRSDVADEFGPIAAVPAAPKAAAQSIYDSRTAIANAPKPTASMGFGSNGFAAQVKGNLQSTRREKQKQDSYGEPSDKSSSPLSPPGGAQSGISAPSEPGAKHEFAAASNNDDSAALLDNVEVLRELTIEKRSFKTLLAVSNKMISICRRQNRLNATAESQSDLSRAWYSKAWALVNMGQIEKALSSARLAHTLALRSENAETIAQSELILAVAGIASGKEEKATKYYESALKVLSGRTEQDILVKQAMERFNQAR